MKALKTIRLDASDALVFDPPAEPGEWAVTGSFLFWDQDPQALSGKARVAFRSGLLGIDSFGWSTLVAVAEVTEVERATARSQLAQQIFTRLGAPSLSAAEAAAEEELGYAESLANHPPNTLIAIHRTLDDQGQIVEQFRTLAPRAPEQREGALRYGPAFTLVATDEEAPEESVDLVSVMKGRHP
ncbi:MAG: hypothetical protein EAZ99_02530 [Alphaproteobacteria bacterium]|nr:MAG: hypothetical protein EAZ99_02530 [Alphaproteobacteria bacterium]